MDTIESTGVSRPKLLSRPPERLHHHAYVVRDQEANRRFLEDLLGIPLVAHVRFIHFVGVEGLSGGKVHVNAPALGRVVLSRERFAEQFTGVPGSSAVSGSVTGVSSS